MNDRLRAAARHPFLPYVVGFVIGTVAIYSVPIFAQELMEGRAPEEHRGPPPGEFREDRPSPDRRGPPPGQEPFGRGPQDQMPREGRRGTEEQRPPMGSEGRPMPGMSEKFGLPGEDRRLPLGELRPEGDFKKPEREGSFIPPSGDRREESEKKPFMPDHERDEQRMREESDRFEQEQATQEARQKEQEKRMFEQMKKSIKQAIRGLENMKKMFDRWSSKGIALPTECKETLQNAQSLVDTILRAESHEALGDADPEDLRDHMETLHECEQKGQLLARVPQVLKRVDREIKNVEKMWARAKKGAAETSSEVVSTGDTTLDMIKQARAKLGESVKAGEVEDLEDIIEDEIFGRFDDIRSDIHRLEAIRNAKKYLSEYNRQIKMARDYIKKLKRASEDTSKLEEILAQAEQQHAVIKTLKPGTEEFQEAVDKLAELGQDFAEETSSEEDFSRELGNIDTKK